MGSFLQSPKPNFPRKEERHFGKTKTRGNRGVLLFHESRSSSCRIRIFCAHTRRTQRAATAHGIPGWFSRVCGLPPPLVRRKTDYLCRWPCAEAAARFERCSAPKPNRRPRTRHPQLSGLRSLYLSHLAARLFPTARCTKPDRESERTSALQMERGDGGGGRMVGPRGVVGSAAMLGLEMHLAHPQQPQIHATAAALQQTEHHGGGGGFQHQPVPVVRQQQQQQPPPSSYSPYSGTSSRVVKAGSHDDEMGNGAGRGGGGVVQQQQQPEAAGCPWTRMKWTDGMVRLLITVVYNVGDDGEGVGAAAVAAGGKAASHGKAGSSAPAHAHGHGHGQAAAQQKKGKWKSVSRAMMDNGFMVSPQQCEDKFNDLNKRYKRVVDLLGRGKACTVVENHALLDTMDELTPKAKDEARKLLSSKHLFFREMCAYHNSGASHMPHSAGEGAACFHHPPPAPMAGAAASSAARQAAAAPSSEMKDSSDSEDVPTSNEVDEEDDDDYDDDEEVAPGIKHRGGHIYINHRLHHHQNGGGHHKRRRGEDGAAVAAGEDEEEDGNKRARRAAAGEEGPSAVQQLQSELAAAAAGGDPQQVRQWVRRRAVEVEEQQVAYECRAYQLAQQRLKWERFRANKEREMERARLRNDRLRIDGRRMLLMLRRKDLDFDIAEANSSSVEHHPAALQQHCSSPSTAGHPN